MLVNINENSFEVKLAITPNAIREGMMNKRFDDSFEGILFLMPNVQEQCFWMKNCIIPLDIIFIQNETISEIHSNCPPCKDEECQSYCGYGSKVLEIAGGRCEELGIKKGDSVNFKLFY